MGKIEIDIKNLQEISEATIDVVKELHKEGDTIEFNGDNYTSIDELKKAISEYEKTINDKFEKMILCVRKDLLKG